MEPKKLTIKVPIQEAYPDDEWFFRELLDKGLRSRYGGYDETIWQKLLKEERVIKQKRLIRYFLAAWDIVEFTKKKEIFLGIGRGSAVASLVNYVLNVTRVDPLKYDLIFERFLNLSEYNEPTIMLDVPFSRYKEIEEYAREHYSREDVECAEIQINGTTDCEILQNVQIDEDSLNDERTFDLLARGDVDDISMLEEASMEQLLQEIKPRTIKEFIDIIALNSFGPSESVMVNMLEEHQAMEYAKELLEPILKETLGMFVYQEQIMKVLNIFAGFSFTQADAIRRSLGAKREHEIGKYKIEFLDRSLKNNIKRDVAKSVWNEMVYYSGYVHCEAHCVGYSVTGYYLAYFKANFPDEFKRAVSAVTQKENV